MGDQQDHRRTIQQEYIRKDHVLFETIKGHLPALLELHKEVQDAYEDGMYRFYHQSWKVYDLQGLTTLIVDQFRQIARETGGELNPWFAAIVTEGTGITFEPGHNAHWRAHTRPIVEAFLHAKYFLEMMIHHGLTMTTVLPPFTYGWAAILTLYNQR